MFGGRPARRAQSRASPRKAIGPFVKRALTEKLVGRPPATTRFRRQCFGRHLESGFCKRGGGFLSAEQGVRVLGNHWRLSCAKLRTSEIRQEQRSLVLVLMAARATLYFASAV